MTNFEILSSSPEFLAGMLSHGLYCGCCPATEECDKEATEECDGGSCACDDSHCYRAILSWLNSAAD